MATPSVRRLPGRGLDKYIPDFVKFVDAYGVKGVRIFKNEEVEGAVKEALASRIVPDRGDDLARRKSVPHGARRRRLGRDHRGHGVRSFS